MKNLILDMSRQNKIGQLSPWFDQKLDELIQNGHYQTEEDLKGLGQYLINKLIQYKEETRVSTVVLGMSGGVDSALTAALFKESGWTVIGVTMPIHQEPSETKRGIDACNALGIKHIHKDLSLAYDHLVRELMDVDFDLYYKTKAPAIRRGNIRARLRMITLYNLASLYNGLVASTDNYSELATGFWTLHGDVGDVSPIQMLLKSWEVPMLAKLYGVPEEIWRAKPTDGLGIDDGDEAQFGFSYLELDIMLLTMLNLYGDYGFYDEMIAKYGEPKFEAVEEALHLDYDNKAKAVFKALTERMKKTWFKREGPICFPHEHRYINLKDFDRDHFWPQYLRD